MELNAAQTALANRLRERSRRINAEVETETTDTKPKSTHPNERRQSIASQVAAATSDFSVSGW